MDECLPGAVAPAGGRQLPHVTSVQGCIIKRTCENAWGTFFYPCLLSTHHQQLGEDCRRRLPGRRPSLSTSGPSSQRQIRSDPTHVGPSAPTWTPSPYCGVTGWGWDRPVHQRPGIAWPPREGTYEGARDRDRRRRRETHRGDRWQRSPRGAALLRAAQCESQEALPGAPAALGDAGTAPRLPATLMCLPHGYWPRVYTNQRGLTSTLGI